MSNYKARMTAQNMEVTEYNKESLVRLMTFATTLGESIDEQEANRTLRIASAWNTKCGQETETIYDLKKLQQNKWAESQDLSDFIAILVDILSESDFFDIQQSLINTLKQYSNDLQSINPTATVEEINKIRFSNTDFACQYYENDGNGGKREVSDSEKYANLMYLSNQLSHAFEEKSSNSQSGINNFQTRHISRELRKIKDWCIHKLIEQKEKGEQIDIALSKDINEQSCHNGRISFSLPNYFEPFIVHVDISLLTEKEQNLCDGTERFSSAGIRTTFPQYISTDKMQLMRQVYKGKFENNQTFSPIRALKLKWFFETEKILHQMVKAKIKDAPSKRRAHFTNKQGNNKAIDIQRENEETLSSLEATLGITLPDYFKAGFLKRTNYSISQYMKEVRDIVSTTFAEQGVSQDRIEQEFAKLIICMKVTKPLSIISQKSKKEKVTQSIDSIENYGKIYDFITEQLQQEEDYSKLKSKTRKYANQLNLDKEEVVPSDLDVETENDTTNQHTEIEKDEKPTITLPTETVTELINEISALNQEATDLTTTMQETAKKLKALQDKIAELQAKVQNIIPDSPTNEDKGDR